MAPKGLSLLLPSSITIIYSYVMLFFISYFVFWHQNLTLCYFLFSIRWHQKGSVCFFPSNITMNVYLTLFYLFCIRWHQRAQFASGTSSITMNIFLRYVIFYLVFGGTKRAQFASPHLTSPWIYILRCNYLFSIRWHQNLTLCYFLFSIRWQQKCSVCFCSL